MKALYLFCWLLIPLNLVFAQETVKQPGELAPRTPVDKELNGGETHAYRVNVATEQYVYLVVDQHGIDVVVKVFGPAGPKLTEVDSPNGKEGPEPVTFIAEAGGAYRIEVGSLDKDAKPGRYEIRLEELRPATARDRTLLTARAAFATGERARLQTPRKLSEAFKQYEDALRLFREAGDRSGEASSLTNLGVVSNLLNERLKALDYLNQALPLHQAAGNRAEEVRTLTYLGFVSSALLERQKALEYFNQVLSLSRAMGDRPIEGSALEYISAIYAAWGDRHRALEYLNQALAIHQAAGDKAWEA